jgi:hypothetical protein
MHDGGEAPERPVPPKPSQASALQQERARLMQSPAFLDKRHRDHKTTLEAYKNVTQKLYGGGAA